MFAIDITPLARPDAQYADERTMVQVRGKGGDRWLPGWPYRLLVGIGWGSSSWVDPIEARRLKPGEEHTDVTIGQITGLLKDLAATGTWQPGDPPPLVLLDAGNYATDLTWALAGHDVQLLVRLRTTRVFYRDPPPRRPGQMGAPARHGAEFSCSDPARRHAPDFEHTAECGPYGTVTVRAGTGLHQKLGSTGRWASWPKDTQLPVVRGTVLQVVVGHLPDGRKPPRDLWLWHAGPVPADPGLLWKAYLRRSGQEHFHRFAKSYLGLASAHLSSAAATDRWVALAMAAYAQLRLARHLVDDLRRPWHPRPGASRRATPDPPPGSRSPAPGRSARQHPRRPRQRHRRCPDLREWLSAGQHGRTSPGTPVRRLASDTTTSYRSPARITRNAAPGNAIHLRPAHRGPGSPAIAGHARSRAAPAPASRTVTTGRRAPPPAPLTQSPRKCSSPWH